MFIAVQWVGQRVWAGHDLLTGWQEGRAGAGWRRPLGLHGGAHQRLRCAGPPLLCRVAPGVLEEYEHLEKHMHPGNAASGSGEAAPQPAGAAEGSEAPAAGGASEMLKTDAPGAGETQHPGEAGTALMQEKVGGGSAPCSCMHSSLLLCLPREPCRRPLCRPACPAAARV